MVWVLVINFEAGKSSEGAWWAYRQGGKEHSSAQLDRLGPGMRHTPFCLPAFWPPALSQMIERACADQARKAVHVRFKAQGCHQV